MSNVPKNIWIALREEPGQLLTYRLRKNYPGDTQYIHIDKYNELVKELAIKSNALSILENNFNKYLLNEKAHLETFDDLRAKLKKLTKERDSLKKREVRMEKFEQDMAELKSNREELVAKTLKDGERL